MARIVVCIPPSPPPSGQDWGNPPPSARTGVSPHPLCPGQGHTTNRIRRGRNTSCVLTQEDFLIVNVFNESMFLLQPFIDAVWMYFLLRFLEVRKYGGDWKDVFLFGDGLKVKTSPTLSCKLILDFVGFSRSFISTK